MIACNEEQMECFSGSADVSEKRKDRLRRRAPASSSIVSGVCMHVTCVLTGFAWQGTKRTSMEFKQDRSRNMHRIKAINHWVYRYVKKFE